MAGRIVILAGEQASRLAPHRTIVPKPLLPVRDRTVLDLMLRHAARHGFTDVTLAVGDLEPLIRAMFGDGGRLGLQISYARESEPLGSAGVLRQLGLDEPFVVVSGSVLSTLDLALFRDAHLRSENTLTVATHRREVAPDFGVLHLGDDAGHHTVPVERYVDRPRTAYTVSMGVYAVQPRACRHVAAGEHLAVPALVQRLIMAGERVGAYEHDGLCLDVRRRDDYEHAIARYEELAPSFGESAEREAA